MQLGSRVWGSLEAEGVKEIVFRQMSGCERRQWPVVLGVCAGRAQVLAAGTNCRMVTGWLTPSEVLET